MAKTRTEDKPYVANYPPLAEWLEKIEARCDWQLPLGTALVEGWRTLRGSTFILVVHADKKGWEIFTALDDNKIDATLLDAEKRLGLVPLSMPAVQGAADYAAAQAANQTKDES